MPCSLKPIPINCLIIIMVLFLPQNLVAEVRTVEGKDLLGKTHQDFSLPNLDGTRQSLSDWKGKTIVLNFWATWCAPCKKEIPMFNKLQKEYAEDDVQFIGVAVDNIKTIRIFIDKVPIDYPVLYGVEDATKITQTYGNKLGVLPYTVFIDKRGRIQTIVSGALSQSYTRQTIEKLLN